MKDNDTGFCLFIICAVLGLLAREYFLDLSSTMIHLLELALAVVSFMALLLYLEFYSKFGKQKQERKKTVAELPESLKTANSNSIEMGKEMDLKIPLYLPDTQRMRHVHILGATGSGKTESVILNFLKQDIDRGLGSIILDAKGDYSFVKQLSDWKLGDRLKIFDLGSASSLSYDPLFSGNPLEAAQRLFSSLTWSEEYYKSKALSALQKMFEGYYSSNKRNPTLLDLKESLNCATTFAALISPENVGDEGVKKDFVELSGLRDQINSLTAVHLKDTLSPAASNIRLEEATEGKVIYFRLQSLMSPQLVSTIGKLIINHMNYLAGSVHKDGKDIKVMVPVYLDEFASFACPEFGDLISKARSAGFALHFSHQSVGDLAGVSKGFLNRITDNSGTKIIMRINDPDTADYFARTFGTKLYQKVTHRITNVKEEGANGEIMGEGSQREAHQFRSAPDLFKTLPTGTASVLIAHGVDTSHGASSVFKVRFPELKKLGA